MIADPVQNTPDSLLTLGANEFQPSDLPTVMRKVFDVAQSHFSN
jgi:A/G-specific adenine glycosylase